VGAIRCLRCETDLSSDKAFYTIARNGQMFGFFCSQGCAQESEHQKYLRAYVLKISQPPATHKDLVLTPDVKVLKQYEEELAKRKIWKDYFS
jgi:YHS domain-containing protein